MMKPVATERASEQALSFFTLKADQTRVMKTTACGTLVDLGDDVLGLEFHSPMQAIGTDYPALVRTAAEEVVRNWRGLVISASAQDFCVGANLLLVLIKARAGKWDEIERAVYEFQQANSLLKYLPRPVVVAPYRTTTGAGLEIAMHAARVVAARRIQLGLVEVAVGLVPSGGGCREMVLRSAESLPDQAPPSERSHVPTRFLAAAFETIAAAHVFHTGSEAQAVGYLRPRDVIDVDRHHLLQSAKETVLALDREGYRPPRRGGIAVAGQEGRAKLEWWWAIDGRHSPTEYDAYVVSRLAYVLSGGDLPAGSLASEQHFLDLEREAFLHLCGHPQTQARMLHMLRTGRPLRN